VSEKYDELGGNQFDRWALPLTVPCPRCKADINVKCTNPVSNMTAHSACDVRRTAAERMSDANSANRGPYDTVAIAGEEQ
jgi:hypothetical protein